MGILMAPFVLRRLKAATASETGKSSAAAATVPTLASSYGVYKMKNPK